jgi:hypothetical protein
MVGWPTITILCSEDGPRLEELLRILGSRATDASWRVHGVECLGPFADRLHHLSDSGADVQGAELLKIATRITQVIDGDFRSTTGDPSRSWIVLRAVDSSSWDVAAEDDRLLELFRTKFRVFEAGVMPWGE